MRKHVDYFLVEVTQEDLVRSVCRWWAEVAGMKRKR